MKKKSMAFLMAFLVLLASSGVFFPPAVKTVQAAEELMLKLHYHRADGSYDGWDVWLWEVGAEGAGYPFAMENGEMVATKVITPGVTSVGFIVRRADWTKDIDEDQFIDLSEMVSGTVHIYVESKVKGYTKEYGEDAVKGVKLVSAKYDGAGKVRVILTGAVDGDLNRAFMVQGMEGTVAAERVAAESEKAYIITLAKELDMTKNYTIVFEGAEYKVSIPSIYSTEAFEAQYTYTGSDLGAVWTREKTVFRVWAPTADEVKVNLYASGTAGTDDRTAQLTMTKDVQGTWIAEQGGDLNGIYYTYLVSVGGVEREACDPYARTTGVNGKRAMVIDLAAANPAGWETDSDPHAGQTINDAVIYELHIRDLSSDKSSGIVNAGKYLGLTETGTKTPGGVSTGLDHIKELGITHLHLLPFYDYGSVDESRTETAQFNWGYDPVNYNVPEGSYSTDPYHGEVRVKEVKQMVQALHANGISVVMDVVYNHVYNAGEFCFNQIVPGYFSRIDDNGKYSNGSGCGNDTATERAMVRKYIVDSVCYWADEYHIDGFRFDLVGLLDIVTVNGIIEEVHKTHPNVIFYGEGWTMDTTPTKSGCQMATQTNSTLVPGMAFFSDTLRDGLKGSVFSTTDKGFVSGKRGVESTIARCFLGMAGSWCKTPAQQINYASCHDNNTLMDRLTTSTPDASRKERIRMNNLAAAVYMTAEGVPFLQAGEEFLRSKEKADGTYDSNSYSSPDSVNSLKWSDLEKKEYKAVFEYYKGLIAFRKAHPVLRLSTAEEVQAAVTELPGLPDGVVGMRLAGGRNGETADGIIVLFNAGKETVTITLPEGKWNICINGDTAGTKTIKTVSKQVKAEPISALVLVQDKTMEKSSVTVPVVFGILAAVAAAIAVVVVRISRDKN